MKYVNREMRIDQIIGYFNNKKFNLIPPFQRGTVWTLADRRGLIANMIRSRPIPAVFLYKEAAGSQFEYNILDGKQRLESLILFIGNKNKEMMVNDLDAYFFKSKAAKEANFSVPIDGKTVSFASLDERLSRSFREYSISTIEIDLDDESTTFDEIVSLFVDINQQGAKVTRFDIVRALDKDRLFNQMRALVAEQQTRGRSKFYKAKARSAFVSVLKNLRNIGRIRDNNSQVERMWERLSEVAMFVRTGRHRRPAEVLDAFIRQKESNPPLTRPELTRLRQAFDYLASAYRSDHSLRDSRLATDQSYFYTMITTILSADLVDSFGKDELARKLSTVGQALSPSSGRTVASKKDITAFTELCARGTADPGNRAERSALLLRMVKAA